MKAIIHSSLLFLIPSGLFSMLEAVPGDLQLEVMTRTGDAASGPGGKALTNLETYFSGERRSVGISLEGEIFFVGEFENEGETESGYYQVGQSGGLSTISETGVTVPGVVVEGEAIVSSEVPWRAVTSSDGGQFQAIGMRSDFVNQEAGFTFDQGFLYRVDNLAVEASPLAWSTNGSLNPKGNFTGPMMISDHRGESVEYFHGGGGAAMMMSNQGTLCWETKTGVFAEIIKASRSGGVSAVVLKNTPAPGFSTEANASFGERNRLLGIDESDRIYFLSEVETSGGRVGTIYRHDHDSGALTVMFIGGQTELPMPDGAAPLTRAVGSEDVEVTPSGTIFLRVPFTSSFAGFWKIRTDGVVEHLRAISDFETIPTNQGGVRLRGVSTGDWAPGAGDVIYFTAGVRLGGSGSDHGVWKYEPLTGLMTTLGRKPFEGAFGDAPGTEATYVSFSNLTACGEYVVFLAELSDGTTGIFGTDTLGGVIKIILEGEALDGSVVTDLYFSPDTAGESLRVTQGMKGLNGLGELAFLAGLANGETALVRASFEGNRIISDDIYVWDGGAGTNGWHDVTGGRSNWVDGSGAPRAGAPPVDGTAMVTIDEEVIVRLESEAADVDELKILRGSLEVAVDLTTGGCSVSEEASLVLEEGLMSSVVMTVEGVLLKEGNGDAGLIADSLTMSGASFSVEGGKLDLQSEDAILLETVPTVESGELILAGTWDFKDEMAKLEAVSASATITIKSGVLKFQNELEAEAASAGGRINWGDSEAPESLGFMTGTGSELNMTGQGDQWLRKPTVIPVGLTLNVMIGEIFEDNSLVIDLGEGERLKLGGNLVNKGTIDLNGGGIQEVGGEFLNINKLQIEGEVGHLDVTSSGVITQSADVRYGRIEIETGTIYRIEGGNLLPGGTGLRALNFQSRSDVTVSGIEVSRIEGLDGAPNYFGSDLKVEKDATLELVGMDSAPEALPGREVDYEVVWKGRLILRDYHFSRCHLRGGGKCDLRGVIEGGGIGSELKMERLTLDLTEASLENDFSTVDLVNFRFGRNYGSYFFSVRSTMDLTTIGHGTVVHLGDGSDIDVDGLLTLDGKLEVSGRIVMAGDIQPGIIATGEITMKQTGRASFNSRLDVPDGISEVAIGVPFHFEVPTDHFLLRVGSIQVGKDSSLVFEDGTADSFFVDGEIRAGRWWFKDRASCDLKDNNGATEIHRLGKNTRLILSESDPGKTIIGDLPSPKHDLSVGGEMFLWGTILNMNLNTLWNLKQVDVGYDAKIIGNVKSIRNEVQGVIKLSGNLNIEGNLTTDGVISLGASPGSGLVTGDLTLLPGSEMVVEFEGTEPGTGFDFLEVGGAVNLDGKLTLKVLDDYLPPVDEEFLFISASKVNGFFDEIDQDGVGRSRRFSVVPGDDGVRAVAEELLIASYEDWRMSYFSEAERLDLLVSGPDADPDGDCKDNLMEYATNGLPMVSDPDPLVFKDGMLSLRWANRVNDVIWDLSTSVGLESWQTAPHSSNLLEVKMDSSIFELEVHPALAVSPERYYQIKLIRIGP